jgi:hypothetical protein
VGRVGMVASGPVQQDREGEEVLHQLQLMQASLMVTCQHPGTWQDAGPWGETLWEPYCS